jgi:hypothetical protein
MPLCAKCGAEIPEWGKFCGKCGSAVQSGGDRDQAGGANMGQTGDGSPGQATGANPGQPADAAPDKPYNWIENAAIAAMVVLGVILHFTIPNEKQHEEAIISHITEKFGDSGVDFRRDIEWDMDWENKFLYSQTKIFYGDHIGYGNNNYNVEITGYSPYGRLFNDIIGIGIFGRVFVLMKIDVNIEKKSGEAESPYDIDYEDP